MAQTFNFDRWVMQGSGWEVSFVAQLENLTITRNYGSDIATVSGKAWIKSIGGSTNTQAKFWIRLKGTWKEVVIPGSNGSGGWYTFWAGEWYGKSFSFNVSVDADASSISDQICFSVYDINRPTTNVDSAYKNYTLSYGSKGASTITSATNVTLSLNGSINSTIKWTPYSADFRFKISATCGGRTITTGAIHPNRTTEYTYYFAFDTSWIDYITTSTSASCTLTLYTYSNSGATTQIGSSSTKTIKLTVPSTGINPTVTFVSNYPAKSAITVNQFTVPVTTLDALRVKWNYSAWKYGENANGSSLNSGIVSIGASQWSNTSGDKTSPALTTFGSTNIQVTATDKRGRSGTVSTSIGVYEYFIPTPTVKFQKSGLDYILNLGGKIAAINVNNVSQNTNNTLELNIYKNGVKINQADIDLSNYIESSVTAGNLSPYNDYYAISGNYILNVTNIDGLGTDISNDITVNTYEFQVIATDSVSQSNAKTLSGISVMTFQAGGTGIEMQKPVIFHDTVYDQSGREVDFDYLQENVVTLDQNVAIVPTYIGQIEIDSTQNTQGMTTDGTYLYMATVDKSDGVSNPKIYRFNPLTLELNPSTPKTPPKKGHYNNLNYYNGYIYATGFNERDVNDDYSQIYKYSWSNNTGSVITPAEWYWTFAIGEMTYDDVSPEPKIYVGHIASRNAFNVFSECVAGSNKYYPFTMSPTEYYNGIEQGCALYNNRFICTILSDARTVGYTNLHSANELLVTNLTGETVKRIGLKMLYYEELQDVCFIGNKAYINSATGRIYSIENVDNLFRGFYENRFPAVWKKPCWLYINKNGTESYYTGTYGSSTGTLLKSFKMSPLTEVHHFNNTVGLFNCRGWQFPIKINPSNGILNISASFTDGSYSYDIAISYTRSGTNTQYVYTLASIKGGYRNANGVVTSFNATSATDIQNVCNNVFYTGSSYVHHIIGETTCKYNYNEEVF